MNKQEAIERIASRSFNIGDTDLVVGLSYTKNIINQINEPQKVTIPKFIADWIEFCKASDIKLLAALEPIDKPKEVQVNPFDEYVGDGIIWLKLNQDTFARAWVAYPNIDTVEQEQLYTVEMPNPNGDSNRYGLCKVDGKIIIGSFVFGLDRANNAKLTESEIKEDFEWAFQFAVPVEEL